MMIVENSKNLIYDKFDYSVIRLILDEIYEPVRNLELIMNDINSYYEEK